MALEVEDGTGKANAEAYISVADADAYFLARGNAAWAALTEQKKEQNLRLGSDYMAAIYGPRWKGERATTTQALDWPRVDVCAFGQEVASDVVPTAVANANAELAVRAIAGPLLADQGQAVKRKKVDVIEVEYADYSTATKTYGAVDGMLAQYLDGSGGAFRKVVRT